MKRSFYVVIFVLALATAYAVSQTGSPTAPAATPPAAPAGKAVVPGSLVSSAAEIAELQKRINATLRNEPMLGGSNVIVHVTADSIELSGTLPAGKEKQTAKRIAQSFAGNRRVVDRIIVTGRGAAGASGTTGATVEPRNDPNNTPPSTTPTTPKTDPQTQGDASSQPRR